MWDFITATLWAATQGFCARVGFLAAELVFRQNDLSQGKVMLQTEQLLPLSEAGGRLGITYLQVLRTCERKFFTDDVKVGRNRFIRVEDLDKLAASAREAGYLQ